jgi:hypothetical protein
LCSDYDDNDHDIYYDPGPYDIYFYDADSYFYAKTLS